MNSFERRNKIIQLVNEQGTVLVQDLAGVFAASEATIRADLRFLEQKGVVTRFHGGAAKIMSGNSETETQEVGFKERFQLASAPKNRIAQAAVKMIHEGMTVILDSGSTTMLIAEGLMTAKNITVITNAVITVVSGEKKVEDVTLNNGTKLKTDGVFVAVGMIPHTEHLKDFLELDTQGYVVADETGKTSQDGFFVAGDVRTKHLRQVITAVADGANAAVSASEYIRQL